MLTEKPSALNSSCLCWYLVSWLIGHLGAEVLQSDLSRPDLNSDELMMPIAWMRCQIEVLRWRV